MASLEFYQPEHPIYEITLLTRNHKNEVTGSCNLKTDSSLKLWEFYQKHNSYRNLKKKRKTKKYEKLPIGQEADKIALEAGQYADNKQKERQEK